LTGKLIFVESTVDGASGTIAMKAAFANAERALWPGMFVNVLLSARTLPGALVVPVQAVQSGPELKFVYVVGEGGKVTNVPIEVELNQAGLAAIKGGAAIKAGARVVVEGAQNVRKDSTVIESDAAKTGKSGGKPGGKSGSKSGDKGGNEGADKTDAAPRDQVPSGKDASQRGK
jgi:RND family efflux transporter MFP subunit